LAEMVQTFVKRTISPLHYEPLTVAPEDVLWPGSEDEADEDEREKKRIRVELLGKQYLEGKPLFIQSAGLRGPFGPGWNNPWANKGRQYRVQTERSSDTRRAVDNTIHDPAERHASSAAAKRRSIVDITTSPSRGEAASGEIREEPQAKRRRHEDTIRPSDISAADIRRTSVTDSLKVQRNDWLKRDSTNAQSRSRNGRDSPTPTPAIRPRSKPLETPPALQQPSIKVDDLQRSYEVDGHQASEDVPMSEPTAIKKVPASLGGGGRQSHAGKSVSKSTRNTSTSKNLERNLEQVDVSKANEEVEKSHEGPTREMALKERLFKARRPHKDSPSRASPAFEKPTSSSLAPHISDIVLSEAATSAGFKAASKSPKPSPRAAPSSTNLPAFRYRYTKQESSSSPSRGKQKNGQSHARARAISISSSGSSDFAEAFEAAQAKAAFPPISSHSSSPMGQRPETKSIKKNTQAMRRLTFTASGEPKIAGSHGSSRPSSNSSEAGLSSINPDGRKIEHHRYDTDGQVHEASTNSSNRSLTNGNRSRNSAVLPEAQVVSNVPAQLVKAPSGLSTDPLETDKQSLKFVSLDEEDSYLDLSTQAAMSKAQREFKDNVLSPLKTSPGHDRGFDKAKITPKLNGHRKLATGRSVVKHEPPDEEEPMSTQAIADAISPFAVTTVKKRPPLLDKRTSFAPSPSRNAPPSPAPMLPQNVSPAFHKPLSMVTTPSNSQPNPSPPVPHTRPPTASKVPSSATSFSMLPNGTLTGTSILQDGQQPQQDFDVSLPSDPFGTPLGTANGNGNQQAGSWDLDAAIEEAGSFLDGWDVEAEARKEGSSSRKRQAGPRSILSTRNGSS